MVVVCAQLLFSMEDSLLSQLDEVRLTFAQQAAAPKIYLNRSNDDKKSPAENMLERMYTYYEEGKFCDFTLVVGNMEIRTHRLVLSSCSLYFSSLFDSDWRDSNEDQHEIRGFDESTLRCVLEFVYTGSLMLNPGNVLRVLAAGDFFQLFELEFIKDSISDYIMKMVNESNCPAMLVIAEQYCAVTLKELLVKYAARNFSRVVLAEDFLKLPLELLVEILQCNMLVVDHGRDFLPLPAEQEKCILDFLLTYISHQSENDEQSDILLRTLVYCIRFHCLCPSSLETLCEYARNANCSESLNLIMQARREIESNDGSGHIDLLWGTTREASISTERYCKLHAGRVNVGPVQTNFGDELPTNEPCLFIQGMKIWIRLWDNRRVIGGLKVFYSIGESLIYGCDDEDIDVYEFHLEEDERVVKVTVMSGWMIDSLMFFTNKGRELGPYGGDGGSESTEQPRGEYGFLSYVKGAVVITQGKLGITKFKLMWIEYLLTHQHDPDEVVINEDHNSSCSSDEHDMSDYTYETESD